MFVRFTKRADGRHRLTVVREDGSVSRGKMVPGLGVGAIPHDLLHALVERTLRLAQGVYGTVNAGLDIVELLDPAQKHMNGGRPELLLSEVVTTLLQGESAYAGVAENDFYDRLRDQCQEHGIAVPSISDDVLRELRRLRDEYERRWRNLAVGDTLEVEMAGRDVTG